MKKLKEISVPVYILVIIFAISSWIDVNGVWVELPLFVQELPEGWSLPSFLVIIIQIANIGPFIYMICRSIWPNHINEVPVIYIVILVGMSCCGLLTQYWNYTSVVSGKEHSVALFILTGVLSLVDCTSSVVYLPYMRFLKTPYISALYFGESLSGLLPGLVGLAQGIGGSINCMNTSIIHVNETTGQNYTEWNMYPAHSEPKFHVNVFFWYLFASLALSLVAFTCIHYLPHSRKTAHIQIEKENIACDVGFAPVNQDPSDSPKGNISNHVEEEPEVGPEHATTEDSQQRLTELDTRFRLNWTHLWYLLVLTVWINILGNGVLRSLQTYSCLPYGYTAYSLSVRLSTVVEPLACILVLFLPIASIVVISSFVGIGSIFAGYLIYLAAVSPLPPLQGAVLGSSLVVLSNVSVAALFAFAKVFIALILRTRCQDNHKALLWCGVATQVGSFMGALIGFLLVNILQLFTAMAICET